MQQQRWRIIPTNQQKTERLYAALNINNTLCSILANRGYDDFENAQTFFRPSLSHLHNPWLMKDMDKAVNRIQQAFAQNERILVYGDYDVDGTTSVATLFQFLQPLHNNIEYYIPHRYKEGYGISKQGILYAAENKVNLIISLDCGIKSADLVDEAKKLGIDFIICDHHLPDANLPNAVAILNPKQPNCNYPFKELCGCGVGFKLMQAIAEKLKLPNESYLNHLDLVATAIAADIVPINGENRTLAYFGLQKINTNPNLGIKTLIQINQTTKDLRINDLVFIIAPRINAAGRMDDAKKAVQLFVEKEDNKAMEIAKLLHSDNFDRKEADSIATEEALSIIKNSNDALLRKSTVVYREHWHKGIVGIVASRLIESYYRPTIVLTKSGDYISGSARSVQGFNLYEAIHNCRQYLIGYGGHFAAAGLTLLEENVKDFAAAFEAEVCKNITPEQLVPEIVIDAEIKFSEITTPLYNIIDQMEPFGPENMRPVFIAKKVYNTGYSKVLKDKHIKFSLQQGNTTLNGIGFNMQQKFDLLQMHRPVDIVFTLSINEWNNNKYLQLQMIDFKLSD